MSADGNWKVTINTPMGARTMAVGITTSGDTFTGKVDSEMGAQEVTGKVDGDTLTWSTDITTPMPMPVNNIWRCTNSWCRWSKASAPR